VEEKQMKKFSDIRETKVELEEGKTVLAKKGDYVFGKDTNKDINYVTYKGKVIATGYFDSHSDAWWLDIDGIKGDVAFDKKAIDVVNYFIKKNITEAVELEEKFNQKAAEKALKEFQKVYTTINKVSKMEKSDIKKLKDVYYNLMVDWFSMKDRRRLNIKDVDGSMMDHPIN